MGLTSVSSMMWQSQSSTRISQSLSGLPHAVLFAVVLLAPVFSAQSQSSAMPRGERHESRHEIDQAQERWRQAVLHADAAALDGLLADDYVGISGSGTLRTKEQTLTSFRSGQLHITQLDLFDRKIRFYGATALINGKAVAAGTTHAGDMSGNFRYTQVFIRDGKGRWKIVSFEINRIREPKDRRDHEYTPPGE